MKKGRSLRFPKILIKKQTWWSNDKTILELGYHKISWFASVSHINYLSQPSASANNWSARHWQITLFTQPCPIIVKSLRHALGNRDNARGPSHKYETAQVKIYLQFYDRNSKALILVYCWTIKDLAINLLFIYVKPWSSSWTVQIPRWVFPFLWTSFSSSLELWSDHFHSRAHDKGDNWVQKSLT